MGREIKVVNVEALIKPLPPQIPTLVLYLEDGREFVLYNVPYEVVKSINKLQGVSIRERPRETIFDLFTYFKGIRDELEKIVEKVVIDEVDEYTGLYTAKLYINLKAMKMIIPMVPSHAIYIALVVEKPIYVDESLIKNKEDYEV
ncbi:hypothetical protein EYM_07060 [Ignicoccus islandicus DSM 13165]|uniref:BFN domain-containing protein n=1 Tax=Ignicoccus islandicus DSM 13165 TaxID=940295 RepID=A0A0U3FR99_9CREN|nr:bifunctional nuclease domain-containing protein [Ignicoccus islandicus]ALU12000.1 hypothetical protein EYM_07060 [Ignicoccus islandicus DSM 13165]